MRFLVSSPKRLSAWCSAAFSCSAHVGQELLPEPGARVTKDIKAMSVRVNNTQEDRGIPPFAYLMEPSLSPYKESVPLSPGHGEFLQQNRNQSICDVRESLCIWLCVTFRFTLFLLLLVGSGFFHLWYLVFVTPWCFVEPEERTPRS